MKLINHDREKLINAILYFAKNTKDCGKTKLLKLLYFLDFEHYKQIGRSVTGLEYFALENGPVPETLYEEISSLRTEDVLGEFLSNSGIDSESIELGKFIKIVPEELSKNYQDRQLIKPLDDPDLKYFSKRELGILGDLVKKYCNTSATDLVKLVHKEDTPWHKVYEVENKRNGHIPYEYATDDEVIKHIAEERKEFMEAFA